MTVWVFGYGSLIWKAGFNYDKRLVGFNKGYRRVFYQGSTDPRGTPEYPGRTVTLKPAEGEVWRSLTFWMRRCNVNEIPISGALPTRSRRRKIKKLLSSAIPEIVQGSKVNIFSHSALCVTYLEAREKQYDKKAYLDFFTEPMATTQAVSGVLVYIASPDKKHNVNYLGPASTEEIAKQIVQAESRLGPNRDYLFHL